ncbi:MAG TPA: LysM domain-containing protein [Anaerolinea sp.]|nr:LysM domain-containing protein [Anaerolinea sp.]
MFLLAEKKPLPKNVVISSRRTPLRENTVFLRMGLAFLFFATVLIGVVAIIIYSYPGNKVPKGPFAVNANFSTVVETSSLIATASTTPSLTATVLKPVCTPPAGWTLYIVAPADTMERLHVFYGIDVAKLEAANCLDNGYVLRAGDQIYIPPMETSTPLYQSATPTRTSSPTPTSSPRVIFYYSFTPTEEEQRPKPPTPVPPTRTPAPTNTPVTTP